MEDKAETCQSDGKKTEESSQKPTAEDSSEPEKVDQKLSPNHKNLISRSRTPQKKVEESKMLQITLQKMDVEMNGKDLEEENEKTEEECAINSEKLETEDIVEEDVDEINSEKIEEGSQGSSLSLHKSETESNKSANSTPKTRTSPRIEASLKNAENFKKPDDVEPEKDSVEMDPLVITDEADPELQFDENSDMESGKGSPVIQRCVTRRSQTRNIPTPRTPKIIEQDQEMENAVSPTEEVEVQREEETNIFNKTRDSTDMSNVSTKVQVGSDVTRLEYTERNISIPVNIAREQSLMETLRCLSPRRPIRPMGHIRRPIWRSKQKRSALNTQNQSQVPIDQVVTGVKRKDRSTTPEETKKFRGESPSRTSLFSSPFTSIRSRFKSDLPSSTPKLLGYRDAGSNLGYEEDLQVADQNGADEKNRWCSIM